MRHAYDASSLCDVISSLGDEALSLQFSRGWFSNRDLVHVLTRALGNVVKQRRRADDEADDSDEDDSDDDSIQDDSPFDRDDDNNDRDR